jgi:hypothetical protein
VEFERERVKGLGIRDKGLTEVEFERHRVKGLG